jgi:putative heme-binding domain-containing protein
LPVKTKHSKLPALGKVKTYDLVSTLAQGDGWHRDTAARLLYERKDPAATALLRATFSHSRIAQARVLSLQALAGAYALTEEDLLRAMADNEPSVRQQGILLSQAFFKHGDVPEALMNQFRALAQDASIQVRYQLAFTLGELQRREKAGLLAQILIRDFTNPWMQNAVLSSAANGAGDLFTVLAGDSRVRNDASGVNFLLQLATMIGISGHQDSVSVVVNFLARDVVPPAQTYNWLFGLGDGLYRTRSSLALVDQQGALKSFYSGALNLASDPSQAEMVRVAATRLLGVSTLGVGSVADWLLLVCSPPTSPALQTAAVEALSHYDDPQLVNGFLQMWPILAPIARTRALNSLLSRDSQVMAVIEALQSGSIPLNAISTVQRNFLRTHNNPQVRSRAVELFGPLPTGRPQVRERFKASLTLRGTADRGQTIFRQRCSECHQSAVPGGEPFGPHLYRARYFSKDQLLSSILEPSQAIRSDYATEVLESKEAQTLVGILADANSTTVTLKQIDGSKIVWPVENIRSLRRETWSLMPEGLENGLSPQDLADLMEYVYRGVR